MNGLLFLALFAASAFAQVPASSLPAACGSQDVAFKVKLDEARHPEPNPETGKARVYFIQDNGPQGGFQHFTLKIGLDGAWAGAYRQNSYFALSVGPGEHHLCAQVQSNSALGNIVELAHFTPEPGKDYYFRTRFLFGVPGSTPPYLRLEPVASDEAGYLIASYPQSLWSVRTREPVHPVRPRDTR